MYSKCSVVGKASTIDIEISPTPSLIFTEGQKERNMASFLTSLNFEPPASENTVGYPKAETNLLCRNDRHMFSPSFMKLGPRIPENRSLKVSHL